MAGQAPRGSRGHGRSSRRASSWPAAAASEAGSGRTARARRPTAETLSPAKALATRSIYRTFLLKGLAPDEAANLTAFVCGIPVQDLHWSLRQVNQLLFLREMAHTGRFGGDDGRPDRPH
jgi:hypothetical protein